MPRPRKYPQELMDRGVRLVLESGRPIAHIAAVEQKPRKITAAERGLTFTLNGW